MIVGGRVLDVPALVDLATGRSAYMRALAYVTATQGHTLAVPAAALCRAAALVDDAACAELAWAVESASVIVLPLDASGALDGGALARAGLDGDVAAAHVACAAVARGWPVVTSAEAAARWRTLHIETETLP